MIELFLCLAVYFGRAYFDLYARYATEKKSDCLRHDIEHDQWNGNGYALNLKESLTLSFVCKPPYYVPYYVLCRWIILAQHILM